MRDVDVRRVLKDRLAAEHAAGEPTLIVDELGLCGVARVDIAVVNGSLAGYEIKSAADNLRRLPGQVEMYGQIFDFAHLVVDECHLEHANQLVPQFWGVEVVRGGATAATIDVVRAPTLNPGVQPFALAQLLWRDEALDELSRRGLDRGVRTKARWHVWMRLAESLTLDDLQRVVRERLRARQGWRDGLQPTLDGVK